MTNVLSNDARLTELLNRKESSLCGLMVKCPDIIYDYSINPKLLSDDGKFYFGIVRNLIRKGVEVIDKTAFMTEVATCNLTEYFEDNVGGYDALKDVVSVVDVNNKDLIIDNWNKWNLVKRYKEKGILDLDKLMTQITPMNCNQLYDYIEYLLNDSDISVSSDIVFETLSYTDQELQELQDGLNVGLQYGKYSSLLNYLTLGVAKANLYLYGGYTNSGKSSFIFENIIIPIVENGHKCCVISNEQKSDAFKILLQIHVLTERLNYWNITRKKIKSGKFSGEKDLEMMKKARDIIKEEYDPYITFVKLFDYNTSQVNKIVKKLSKTGYECFFYDTFKIGESDNSAVWAKILADSKDLFQIASKNDVAIVMSVQLALHTKNKTRWLDEGVLSNGKQMAEVVETGIYMRDIWSDEIDKESNFYIHPYRNKRDANGKYTKEIEEVTLDKNKKYKLMFLSKCRADENGQVILYEYKGDYNKWIELCRCKPHTKNLY